MSLIEDANTDPGDGSIETTIELPPGCLALRSIEVMQFLDENGKVACYVRWQGTGDIVAELGMLEYAKNTMIDNHREATAHEDGNS